MEELPYASKKISICVAQKKKKKRKIFHSGRGVDMGHDMAVTFACATTDNTG